MSTTGRQQQEEPVPNRIMPKRQNTLQYDRNKCRRRRLKKAGTLKIYIKNFLFLFFFYKKTPPPQQTQEDVANAMHEVLFKDFNFLHQSPKVFYII